MYTGAPTEHLTDRDAQKARAYHSTEGREAACELIDALGYDHQYVLDEHGSSQLCWDHDGTLKLRVAERDDDGKVIYTAGGATVRTDYVTVPPDLLAIYRSAIGAA